MPVNDLPQGGQQLVDQVVVGGRLVPGAGRLDEPQRGVGRVVARRRAGPVREVVGQQTVRHETGVGAQDRRTVGGATGCQRETRQGDHRVAAPVVEPVVAGDDGRPGLGTIRPVSADQELVGREHEAAHKGAPAVRARQLQQVTLASALPLEGRLAIEAGVFRN